MQQRVRRINWAKVSVLLAGGVLLVLAAYGALSLIGGVVFGLVGALFGLIGAIFTFVFAVIGTIVKLVLSPIVGLVVIAGAIYLFYRYQRRSSAG